MSIRGALGKLTPRLFFIVGLMSLGNIIYGYDTASFGGVQAIPAFGRQFGAFDSNLNRYALPARTSSLLTSLAFLGKLIGTIIVGPCTEKFGHRVGMIVLCAVTIVGTIIQLTAKEAAQFLVGRIIVYIGVGIVENVVPTYQSEIVPAGLRGPVVGSLQMLLACGALIASGVNRRYSTSLVNSGWQIPVAVQMITPFVILCGLPFVPPSPRWLLYKGRRSDAIAVLEKVRPKEDVRAGLCVEEVDALEESIRQESKIHQSFDRQKLGWSDLFRGTNLRRTTIATMGSIAAVAMFYALFFVPETKGRSLEELDELFEHKPALPAWKFKGTKTTGVGAKIGALEDGRVRERDDEQADNDIKARVDDQGQL
ncbi:hypothetical protein PQX77_019959 [Marasmius sp. AFHP31]|nr:hypothetical protein PQX77_019959 [Marasmius sp. AFHP31]